MLKATSIIEAESKQMVPPDSLKLTCHSPDEHSCGILTDTSGCAARHISTSLSSSASPPVVVDPMSGSVQQLYQLY